MATFMGGVHLEPEPGETLGTRPLEVVGGTLPDGPGNLIAAGRQEAVRRKKRKMAMLAGVRAAFESLLVHFNPDRFEQEADGGSKRSAFAGKGKYWERYREHFEGLNKDPDDCFRRLFGDEFARAYEEQLSRLKSARRMRQAARH